MRRWSLAAVAAILAWAPLAVRAAPEQPDPSVYDQAWRIFKDQFYRRDHKGVDWGAAKERHRPKAQRASSQREVHEAILDLLAELKSSHATVVSGEVYSRFYDAEGKSRLVEPPPQFGMKIARLEEGFFVADVLYGSAAAAAGVMRGDRVIAIGGQPPDERKLFAAGYDSGLGGPRGYRLRCEAEGDTVELQLERFQQPKYGRCTVTLVAARWNEVEAARMSRQVFDVCGTKVAYFKLYHVLCQDVVLYLEDFLGKVQADAFVLDIRGMGGLPPLVDQVSAFFDRRGPGRALWGRPVVALIDGSSRSAKEALAWRWRHDAIGPLVGTKTAGAVLGAQFKKLRDGSWLMVPKMDMRSVTGGVVVEGNGVAPDIEVEIDLPWSRGKDPILERGLSEAAALALAARRRGKRHGWH